MTRGLSEQRRQNTPVSPAVLPEVTVIHPFHPLRGQRVKVLCVYQHLPEAILYVQPEEGNTLRIAVSLTDYAGESGAADPAQLLTWQGLQHIARFMQRRLPR